MLYTELPVHPSLSSYIAAYWTLTHHDDGPKNQRILPDGCVDIIFNLGAECTTAQGSFLMASEKAYLVDTMTTFTNSCIFSGANLLGVRFKPAAFPHFFRCYSLDEVTDQTVELDKSVCPDLGKLLSSSTIDLDCFFAGKLAQKRDSIAGIVADMEALRPEQLHVNDIAERYFISPRQLERKFKQQIGVSPKTFINILRNRAALLAIKKRSSCSFLEIALEHGYYDHAHLSNEIRRFTGEAPSRF